MGLEETSVEVQTKSKRKGLDLHPSHQSAKSTFLGFDQPCHFDITPKGAAMHRLENSKLWDSLAEIPLHLLVGHTNRGGEGKPRQHGGQGLGWPQAPIGVRTTNPLVPQ